MDCSDQNLVPLQYSLFKSRITEFMIELFSLEEILEIYSVLMSLFAVVFLTNDKMIEDG